jgi:hypothetical protein
MSHVLELTEEQYKIIKAVADASGRTPEDLFLAWTMEEETRYRLEHPTHYETDEWLRHLGVSEDRIQRLNEEVVKEDAADADS